MDVQILYSRNFGLRTSQQHSSVIDDRSISVTSASSRVTGTCRSGITTVLYFNTASQEA